MSADGILIAKTGDDEIRLSPRMANRHGLIAGATGTGKTVTLQTLAEGFSRIGVPVFMADVKGDLSGISQSGDDSNAKVAARVKELKLAEFSHEASPVAFWDVFGEQGHPMRATVSEIGPLLFARILDLNDIQTGVLSLTFKVADDNGLLLLDMKDLRAMVQYVGENAKALSSEYGNVAPATIGAIQRSLLNLERQGGDKLLGEPALDLHDLIRTDHNGRGIVNILAADRLIQAPKLYATFLLWLLSELYETLPEIGDPDRPKLVFFFDEAHLLFDDAPDALLDKVQQVVRLVRSKGVGVYFVTQNPRDVPDRVLGQLGNRVQHALRAYTPNDQKAVRAAADTFRQNPDFRTEDAIKELGVGEALVSFLDDQGVPAFVRRALIVPPRGRIGPISDDQRAKLIRGSILYGKYEKVLDRESAYEILRKRSDEASRAKEEAIEQKKSDRENRPKSRGDSLFVAFCKSAARSIGSALGRTITRGVLGNILGGGRGRSAIGLRAQVAPRIAARLGGRRGRIREASSAVNRTRPCELRWVRS